MCPWVKMPPDRASTDTNDNASMAKSTLPRICRCASSENADAAGFCDALNAGSTPSPKMSLSSKNDATDVYAVVFLLFRRSIVTEH
jgi:hypothetical protein